MSRVFIIGAGFSKAVANTPLASEFFELIYERAVNPEANIKNLEREDANFFINIVHKLQSQIKPTLELLQRDGTKIKTSDKFPNLHPIDIEFLCTFLDLNIQRPHIPHGIGVDLKSWPIPFFNDTFVDDLKAALRFVEHYIVRIFYPDGIKPNMQLLEKAISFISPGDTIITFNYDILIEQELWRNQLWNPLDGYLIGTPDEKEKINRNNLPETKIPVIKLHGSVNWKAPHILSTPDLTILTTDLYTNEPIFDNFPVTTNRSRFGRSAYPLPSHVIIPTFMKAFQNRWEFTLVRQASEAISKAKEIYFWGYSLPVADAVANYICNNIPQDARIYIIDPGDPENLAKRIAERYGVNYNNIIFEKCGLEDWVRNDFKYPNYEQEKKIREAFQAVTEGYKKLQN